MDPVLTLRRYIDLMLKEVSGVKVILLDFFTRKLLSLVYSHSEVLKKDVLLVDMLENANRGKLANMKCLIFVRPTQGNAMRIKSELANPHYDKYFIFFTHLVEKDILQVIAEGDKKENVEMMKELFCDYVCADENVFSFAIPSVVPLYFNYEDILFERICDGLLSMITSVCQQRPFIRYCWSSQVCTRISKELVSRMNDERIVQLFQSKTRYGRINREDVPLVLLLDRRNDPVTPLLTQWTYQSMVHEIIGKGIKDNVIKLKKKSDEEEEGENEEERRDGKSGNERKEILFSSIHDDFLKRNMYKNWGEICSEMKRLVEKYRVQMKSKDNLDSIEDLRNFIENYSSFKKINRQTNDHMSVVYALKEEIKNRSLLDLSRLEQEIVCGSGNQKEVFQNCSGLLNGRIRKDDAIKLLLIYLLRYESYSSSNRINELVRILKEKGVEKEDLKILHGILMYGGEKIRKTKELFEEEDSKGLKGIFRRVKGAMKDVENVYTQHVPLYRGLMDQILKGTLNEHVYPFQGLTSSTIPKKIVVFIVGGITYEETKTLNELQQEYQKRGCQFLLGGTRMLNSKYFIKEVLQYQKEKESSQYDNVVEL